MDPTLALVLQALLIGAALALALFGGGIGRRQRAEPPPPPCLPGLPILGNCIALGRRGAAVLLAARRDDYGDCFAVRAFPFAPPLVFIFHPRAVAAFFAAPESELAFKPAVRMFTERVFGLPGDEFSSSHEPLLDALRQLLSPPERLQRHAAEIAARAAPLLEAWAAEGHKDQQPFDLWPKVRTLVFQAAGGALFGDAFFQRHGPQRLERLFLDFEGDFEKAASPVPHFLLPRFVAAKRDLLAALAASLASGDLVGTVAGELAARSGVRAALQPSVLLSAMWASQANSMPAVFWALAFLLQQQQPTGAKNAEPSEPWLGRVREAAEKAKGGEIEASLDPAGPSQRAANEAIRARAHSIAIRLVPPQGAGHDVPVSDAREKDTATTTTTTTTKLVRAPPGSVLAVCPFESHGDARFFAPTPREFDPSRPPTAALPGGGGVGMGFGGGFWRCPGRLFAGMELGLLISMVATRLDLVVVQREVMGEEEKGVAGAADRAWWERAAVAVLGEERARYGLGVGLDDAASAPVCPSLMPPADLKRLVGFKVPAAPLMVVASYRGRRREDDEAG